MRHVNTRVMLLYVMCRYLSRKVVRGELQMTLLLLFLLFDSISG